MAEGSSGTISPVSGYSPTGVNKDYWGATPQGQKVTNRQSPEDLEPIQDGLEALIAYYDLGLREKEMPEDLKEKLSTINDLVINFLISQGKDLTHGNYNQQLKKLEKDLDLEEGEMATPRIEKLADKGNSFLKVCNGYFSGRLQKLWDKTVKLSGMDLQDYILNSISEYVQAEEKVKEDRQAKMVEKYLKGKQEEDKEEENE